MRWIAVVLMILAATAAVAEDQEHTYKLGVDAESVDEVARVVERYVDGPLHTYYEGAVRKNQIVPLVQIAGLALLALAGVLLLRQAFAIDADPDAPHEAEVPWFLAGGLVAIVAMIGVSVWFGEAMPRVVAPEYYAIRDILETLR